MDTVHFLPGELLDYPVILPYLNEGAVIVLHDTGYHQYIHKDGIATQIVLDVAVGEKIIPLGLDDTKETELPNISAIQINTDTAKYISTAFHAMVLPWWMIPDDSQLKSYYKFYRKHYAKELACFFKLAVRCNKNYRNKKKGKLPIIKRVRRSIGILIHGF